MQEERRRVPRRRTLKGAMIVFNDGRSTIAATVRNLSDDGANVRVASIVGIPDTFVLRLSDGTTYECRAIWHKSNEIGVAFATASE
jgi:hypothetical protein